MSQHTEQPPSTYTIDPETLLQDLVFSPIGFLALLMGGYFIHKTFFKRKPLTNILARGEMAKDDHLVNGMREAISCMQNLKRSNVALYAGTPKGLVIRRANEEAFILVPEDVERIYTTKDNSGLYCEGTNGSGKSYSLGLPRVRSALDLGCGNKVGFPVSLYDIKFSTHSKADPCPAAQVAGHAKMRGYRVHVLAPGCPKNMIPVWANACTLNILDFVRSPEDVEMARALVIVLLKNAVPGFDKTTPYFRDGCVSALTGFILYAKRTNYPDLLTCLRMLEHPNLLQIINHPSIPQQIGTVFRQFLDCADTPEAFIGIKTTVSNVLATVLMPAIAPSICGKTTFPLDVDGNDLIILGVDGERRDIVTPIIAAVIHLHVNRNLLRPRESPYYLWLDEVGSIFLPDLDEWPNQLRSAGLVLDVYTQSPEMLHKRYGVDGAKRIAKGCASKAIFQLGDYDDAKRWSQYAGRTDVLYDTEGESTGKGKNNGSRSKNQQRQTIDLLEPQELLTAPRGKALLINRGFGDESKNSLPVFRSIEIPPWDKDLIVASEKLWQDGLTREASRDGFTEKDYQDRTEAINLYFGPFPVVDNVEEQDTLTEEEQTMLLAMNFFESQGKGVSEK